MPVTDDIHFPTRTQERLTEVCRILVLSLSIVSAILGRRRKKSKLFIILLIVIELTIEIVLIVVLTMASNFTTTLAKVAFTADNLDELVSKPSYGSITNYNSTLTMSSIAKPVIVELDMLIDDVLAIQEVRSLPYYDLLTMEFFLGFPCVESSGIMVLRLM